MTVHLRFFSTMRTYFKKSGMDLHIDEPQTAKEIFLNLFADRDRAGCFLKSTRFAVNCEYVPSDTVVKDGDELSFIPPVSGG